MVHSFSMWSLKTDLPGGKFAKSSGIGENGSIKWVDEVFPYDVEEILLHEGYIDDDENPENSYEPSDDNDNEFWIDLYPCHHFLADISYTCFYMD